MTLKDTLKPKTSKNNSSKNPAFYNKEKSLCILKGATSDDKSVRMYFATSPHIPTSTLTSMLENETDRDVLRSILMNNKLPRKSVTKFVNNETDERVEWFADDQELISHFQK